MDNLCINSEDEKNKDKGIISSQIYSVNSNYIESREFNDKVLRAIGNIEDKRKLYSAIKDILSHRSGTNGEDIIIYNLKTKELYVKTDSNIPSTIRLNDKEEKIIARDPMNVIIIHNHPASMPPSIEDLNALYYRGQKMGFIVTHNGKIFMYTKPNDEIKTAISDRYVAKAKQMGYNKFDEQIYVIRELSILYNFEFKEVK